MTLPLAIHHLEDTDQREALEQWAAFSTMTRDGPATWKLEQIALLLDTEYDVIEEIGVVRRSAQRVATGWHRLTYVRRIEIPPLGVDELVTRMNPKLAAAVERRVTWSGVLPPRTSDALAALVSSLRPELALVLQDLRGQGPRPADIDARTVQTAGHEADAVRLALDIADFPRRQLREVRPDGHIPFVQRLRDLRVGEDPAVAYDAGRFLDFKKIDHPAGLVTFVNRGERLVVLNVNRQPLERTTGADLIYLNERTGSWVLVQYKSLRREERADGGTRLVYRPTSDAQLQAELDRMRKLPPSADDGTPAAYRLHAGCCFLKLCKPVSSLEHASRELVSGMYLPLDYYDVLVGSKDTRGPKGGVVLGYDTIRRAVSNDLFIGLVRGGWVGSRGAATETLTDLVLAGLSADRSITFAASTVDPAA